MAMSERTVFRRLYLRDDDELIEVKITDNTEDIFLVTKIGHVYPIP